MSEYCKNVQPCLVCGDLFCGNCTDSDRDDCCSMKCEEIANQNDIVNARDDEKEEARLWGKL